MCVSEYDFFRRTDFFLPGPPSSSLLGMGSGATDGERLGTQRRSRAIAKTPRKKDGERWQSCLAPCQFPAEDGQILLPGLCMSLCKRGGVGAGLLAELGSRMGRAPFCGSRLDFPL